ncbi:MAG: rhodanese-like domain-containing protein [Burkholderiales bacterium]|nr:MAG: rhodanese-like domain-containing protein [Burkholderiales bacterium]
MYPSLADRRTLEKNMSSTSTDCANVCAWELAHLMDLGAVTLIDVRDPDEFAAQHIPGAIPLPLAELSADSPRLAGAKRLVLCCATGKRSAQAVERLKAARIPAGVSQLRGGVQAWMAEGLRVTGSPVGDLGGAVNQPAGSDDLGWL